MREVERQEQDEINHYHRQSEAIFPRDFHVQDPDMPLKVAINESLDDEKFYSFYDCPNSCVGMYSETEILRDLPNFDI